MITLSPSGVEVKDTEPGFYTIQLNQTLAGGETIALTGGGQTFHTFDSSSIDDLSGITIWYVLDNLTITAAGNTGDLEIAFERVVFS